MTGIDIILNIITFGGKLLIENTNKPVKIIDNFLIDTEPIESDDAKEMTQDDKVIFYANQAISYMYSGCFNCRFVNCPNNNIEMVKIKKEFNKFVEYYKVNGVSSFLDFVPSYNLSNYKHGVDEDKLRKIYNQLKRVKDMKFILFGKKIKNRIDGILKNIDELSDINGDFDSIFEIFIFIERLRSDLFGMKKELSLKSLIKSWIKFTIPKWFKDNFETIFGITLVVLLLSLVTIVPLFI